MNRHDDSRRLTHARRLLAVQTAAGVVVGVLIVGAVTLAVVLSRQDADLSNQLRRATVAADTADPPRGTWLVTISPSGVRTASRNAPEDLPSPNQAAEVRGGEDPLVEEVEAGGQEYLTRTVMHGDTLVQAGVDFGPRDAERGRLLLGLGIAGTIAALAAAVVGMWLSRRAIAPLADAMERQRRFVSDASHELRTPLSRMTLRAQLIQRSTRGSGVDADAAQLVAEAQDMSAIIEDLLLSAQLEQSAAHGELVDVEAIARAVITADQPRAEERGLHLAVRTSDCPPVRGVRIALTRAVNALVDNAMSHAPDGGHVLVSVEPGRHGRVILAVADDGPGIDPAAGELLFERFARGHDQKGRFGLGLALVREVVETHGGTIRLDPEHSPGARFVITLPGA